MLKDGRCVAQGVENGAARATFGATAFSRLAALVLHPRLAVAAAATKLVVSLARMPGAPEAFAETDAVTNLARKLRDVTDAAAPWAPATRGLRESLMRGLAMLLPASPAAVASVARCLPQLVQAARLGHGVLQHNACAVIVLLTSARFADAALSVAASLTDLQLPAPLGRAAAADADAQASEEGPAAAASTGAQDVLLRLRSAVVPPLVDQMRPGRAFEAVPQMLHVVIADDPVLARAAADTSALEQLAAIVISEARPPALRRWLGRRWSVAEVVKCARVDVQAASLNEAEDAMAVDGATGGSEAPSGVLRPAFCCIELLCSCSSPDTPGATNATAMLWERHRAAVCTPAAIAAMCKCLAHPDAHVRLAVAKSLRVLARSQDAFTQETLGDGQLAEALVAALHGEEATSIEVCLAISNFVTTPSSPARQQFFDKVRPNHYCPCAWSAGANALVLSQLRPAT